MTQHLKKIQTKFWNFFWTKQLILKPLRVIIQQLIIILLYYNNLKFLEATMWHHHSVDNLEKFTYILLKNKTRRDEMRMNYVNSY